MISGEFADRAIAHNEKAGRHACHDFACHRGVGGDVDQEGCANLAGTLALGTGEQLFDLGE